MMCVSSVSYSFMINGLPKGYVLPSNGLRQGDPILPYLFLLCAENLSALIEKKKKGIVWCHSRISVCPATPLIHHLLFADKFFVFARAHKADFSAVNSLLHSYQLASEQQVNLPKKKKRRQFASAEM